MSAISFGGKTLGALALAGVIGVGFRCWAAGEATARRRAHRPTRARPRPRACGDRARRQSPGRNMRRPYCPVMGGKINKAIFADYQGKRVYFCCGGCPAVFAKDPAKYVKAMEDKGVVLDKTPQ